MHRYQKLEKVGEGACGVVFKCRDRESDDIVAVKKIRYSYESCDSKGSGAQSASVFGAPAAALREVSTLQILSAHPHVVGLRDAFVDDGARFFIVCEFMDRDLRAHMDLSGPLHPGRLKLYTWQMTSALAFCHARRISHRDVKPQNILVNVSRDIVKLCDFSLARHLMVSVDNHTKKVASLWYRAPELLLGGEALGPQLDVWSLGCVLGEMMGHDPVFPGNSEIETLLMIFRRLGTPREAIWPGLSVLPHWSKKFPRFQVPADGLQGLGRPETSGASQLLRRIMRLCPSSRQSAEVALTNEYFSDLDRTALEPLGQDGQDLPRPTKRSRRSSGEFLPVQPDLARASKLAREAPAAGMRGHPKQLGLAGA